MMGGLVMTTTGNEARGAAVTDIHVSQPAGLLEMIGIGVAEGVSSGKWRFEEASPHQRGLLLLACNSQLHDRQLAEFDAQNRSDLQSDPSVGS